MKKLSFLFCMVFFSCIAFSCLSTYVWDDKLPPEQSAKVFFVHYYPKSYNGVNAKPFYLATLPAGAAEFCGDIQWSNRGVNTTTTFNQKDVNFSCNLESGKEYTAVATFEYIEETESLHWGIGLYKEIKTYVGNTPPEERFIAFIPFDPSVFTSNRATSGLFNLIK